MSRNSKSIKIGLSLISIIVSMVCSFFIINTYALADNATKIIKVFVDGRELDLDVPPAIISGRTLVPLRAIFESLGADVKWDAGTKTVTGIKNDTTIELTINKKNAFINGRVTPIDVPALIVKGRTLVPARFVAESLGTDVEWKSQDRVVEIVMPKAIRFTDTNLEAVVRTQIKKPVGDILTSDVKNIVELDAAEKGIVSLEGIEYFTSIRELDLESNKIRDINKLSALKNLNYLYLSDNCISDISGLKGLSNLKMLALQVNQVSDISSLSDLADLHGLDLAQNQISDISPIKSLTNLEMLNLWSNPILDISVLKEHKSIRKLYLLASKGDIVDDALFQKYEQMGAKVREIIGSLIKPEMTEYEKELILHDYLVTRVKYDKQNLINDTLPDETHTAYGALINGIAVCDGYARSFQILMNAVGIECSMIVGDFDSLNGTLSPSRITRSNGEKWKHAWNIVKINNNYYQVDVTADDPVSNDDTEILSHQYFNISDKQMGTDHRWDRSAYTPCVEDSELFNLIAKERKNLIITNDKYYYISPESGITSINFDGSSEMKIVQDKVYEIVLMGDYIYYINNSDKNTLYRVKTDGTSKTKLGNTKVVEIDKGSDNSIYFIADYKINKVGPEGENQSQLNHDDVVSWVLVEGNEIFYKVFNFDYGARLKKADLNGGNSIEIVRDEPTGYILSSNGRNVDFWYTHYEHVLNGWIYYVNKSDSKSIYRVKLDGSERSKVCSDSVDDGNDIEILGNYIYYRNSNDGNKYYRVNLDGSNRQAV
ncbi:MAG TPA: leucine-rich repeat protein [Pseudobacteroides sp.]|uniref:leucine-rich repeat protein n=1 Tax=Pseudobacteroides sp. TaxID=1968840 RepID=UPI002F945342